MYRELNQQQTALYEQGIDSSDLRRIIREQKAEIDAELEAILAQYWRADREHTAERRKIERYCHDQRNVLRQLVLSVDLPTARNSVLHSRC